MRAVSSGLLAWLLVGSTSALAHAQAPPAAPTPAAADADASDSDESAGDADEDAEPPPAQTKKKEKTGEASSDETPAEPTKEAPSLPPPPPPRTDEQEPRPYLFSLGMPSKERHVELGPDLGVWVRPAKGDQTTYAPAFAWGVHVRAELWQYLDFAAYFSHAKHAVEIPRGSLGLADTQIDQPALDVLQLGARLEPTLRPMASLRLWLGLGVAWGHVTADAPSMSGANASVYADRTGVYVEYSAAIGATWDVVPNWLALSLSASGGVLTNQSGDLFHSHQVITQNGTTASLGAMPEFESSYSALFGAGIVL